MKAQVLHRHGGPDAFSWEDVEVGEPGPGEARVRHTAIALNWADLRYREGGDPHYPVPRLPAVIGLDAVGVVEAVGPGVTEVRPGDRVGYGAVPLGTYAEVRLMAAKDMLVLPDGVTDEQVAASYIKGLTAQYLVDRAYPVQAGETLLVHAAAGGVGLILSQLARLKGARVIGTAGGPEKVAFARDYCDEVIDYRSEDFVARARALTGGRGVDAVFDSVGLATFMRSLDALRVRGMMVSYGHASGPVPPLDIVDLAHKGSLYLTRATGRHYNAGRENFERQGQELFGLVAAGKVRLPIRNRYALRDVAQAHRDLAARKLIGLSVLLP